tara:strand:- start:3200 stop:3808 length:609 start_codon:yes stop_codon:yes gene_type:complete
MGEFGWAYLNDVITGQGPEGALQYVSGTSGMISGSNKFVYNNASSTLSLTGSMIISGTLQAHTFDVVHTNKIELNSSGSTNFGNDSSDTHVFTGSVSIVSGGVKQAYHKLVASSYTVTTANSIIGVSSSAYVSIQLPSASVVGAGHTLIIKDEYNATRVTATQIVVSASGGNTIDHATTYSITGDSAALTLYSDGTTNWFIY